MSKPNILVIAQDTSTQDEFKDILSDEFEHVVALNGIDGVALSRMTRPAIVFVDFKIPNLNAVGVCKSLLANEKVRSIPVIVLADTANVNGELKTLSNFGGVLQRPIQAQQVKSKIHLALEAGQAPGEGPGGNLCRWNRQPLFHHGYGCGAQGPGDPCGCPFEGYQGRRHL